MNIEYTLASFPHLGQTLAFTYYRWFQTSEVYNVIKINKREKNLGSGM